jgi:tryptophanyl-tRNA synthetase
MEEKQKKIIVTGAQPTGMFHLGNYLGAVKNWRTLQHDYECFFFIPNLHSITVPPYVPAELRKRTYSMLAQYLACGLDPESSHMFAQSSVVGHTELSWILGCLTPVGQLFRMTQFKSKSENNDFVGSGLLYYPILMAADILLYNADCVPVGEDQKQHVELTRDLAIKFNQTYSETFKVPEPYILKTCARVYSLQNPTKKMSKSDANKKGTVFLFESPEDIQKKFRSAVTDSGSGIYCDPEKPGITNLVEIFAAVTEQSIEAVENQYRSYDYGTFKNVVAEAVIEHLKPIQAKYAELMADQTYLQSVLDKGREFAQKCANRMMAKVYRKAGMI